MSTHSGERRFICDQCNYSCIQANDIKKHMPQHSGEKPFACNQCSFSCRRTSRLKYHMLSHAGEKPFPCKKCKNSCRQSHDLKTHMKTHFYFKMLITFEPNVAQRSVASQNDHKSKVCLPEASNTAFTMYRRLKRRLRRLYEAPCLAPQSSSFDSPVDIQMSNSSHWSWVSHIVICAD